VKPLDRLLQRWRIQKARPWLPAGGRVLDVGCADGALFRQLGAQLGEGVGIDPELKEPVQHDGYRLLPGVFPDDLDGEGEFDTIVMSAVLEHVPPERRPALARACARHLRPGGHLVITAPAPLVDRILDALLFLRLIDGMALDEHHGFEPDDTPTVFAGEPLVLVEHRRFQLGLNHLFVFQRL
jgi:2-polyprenyl-3-methyl-5-hydroxy-6-metoxy-1,4-benzoquinol methylase